MHREPSASYSIVAGWREDPEEERSAQWVARQEQADDGPGRGREQGGGGAHACVRTLTHTNGRRALLCVAAWDDVVGI